MGNQVVREIDDPEPLEPLDLLKRELCQLIVGQVEVLEGPQRSQRSIQDLNLVEAEVHVLDVVRFRKIVIGKLKSES